MTYVWLRIVSFSARHIWHFNTLPTPEQNAKYSITARSINCCGAMILHCDTRVLLQVLPNYLNGMLILFITQKSTDSSSMFFSSILKNSNQFSSEGAMFCYFVIKLKNVNDMSSCRSNCDFSEKKTLMHNQFRFFLSWFVSDCQCMKKDEPFIQCITIFINMPVSVLKSLKHLLQFKTTQTDIQVIRCPVIITNHYLIKHERFCVVRHFTMVMHESKLPA